MTKYLDTYEIWDKIFKLTRDTNENYKIYVHDNYYNSSKMSTIIMDKKEFYGFIQFLQEFVDEQD